MNNLKEKKYRFDIITHKFLDYEFEISCNKKPTIDQLLDELAKQINEKLISWGEKKLGSSHMYNVCEPDHITVGFDQFDDDQEEFWEWLEEEEK